MHGPAPLLGGTLIWLWVPEAQNQRNVLLSARLISRVIVDGDGGRDVLILILILNA